EESGGIGIASHIPERDALLAGILVAQLMLAKGKTLQGLIDSMEAITGRHYYRRRDIHIRSAGDILEKVMNNRDTLLNGFGDYALDDTDGLKFVFRDGGFLMVRASGTEPVLRIYAELEEKEKTELVIDGFISRLESITGRSA
ncbi:MAG: phosphoglucomutase/phosphomannomutase family protein, partial [Deltaproteobacteria bacterium]|nr:phosphoglucomutase/phosphomannomutase family protein [Deltaproteobacteria bacterium]